MAWKTEQYFQVILYSVLAAIIIIINLFSIVILTWSTKLLSRPSVVLLINLIATHFIQGVVVMPIYALRKGKEYPVSWYPAVCDTWRFSYMITFYVTCINVLLIALDRFVATKYAIKYQGHYKHKHFLAAVGIAWFYVLALCAIPFIPTEKAISLKAPFYCNYNQQAEWSSFMLIFNTVGPYILVIMIYVYISRKLRFSSNVLFQNNNSAFVISNIRKDMPSAIGSPDDGRERNVSSLSADSSCIIMASPTTAMSKKRTSVQYRKINQLTFRIIFIYGITWAPSIVYYSIVTMTPDIFSKEYYISLEEMIITFIMKYITFFNAAAAPILYCYQHGEFRKEAKRFFRLVKMKYCVGIKKTYQMR